jgi:hypothetical protein
MIIGHVLEERSLLGSREAIRALGGRSLLEAARTELGGRQVERILLALEFGLPI